jgi:RNA polymerase sigma factor for flagellar operon FliA
MVEMAYESRSETLHGALPIMHAMAFKMWRRLHGRLELEELVSVGHATLHDALSRYDRSRGPFAAYLIKRLTWAMISEARRFDRRFDPTRGTPAGVAKVAEARPEPNLREVGEVSDAEPLDGELDPEDVLMRREARHVLRTALANLPAASREIIERHYFDGEHFAGLAEALGISKSRACRLHKAALTELARELGDSWPREA